MRLVEGVGINDKKYSRSTKQYDAWRKMLVRCYSLNQILFSPTYVGCTVSENFKSYSYFYNWCQNQKGFENPGWQLDKDILVKGNKIYSEDLCVFVPSQINSLLVSCKASRGLYPIGVSKEINTNLYGARLSINGKLKRIGLFHSPEEAFLAYKAAKEFHIKELAIAYQKDIDIRTYNALMSYLVEIGD